MMKKLVFSMAILLACALGLGSMDNPGVEAGGVSKAGEPGAGCTVSWSTTPGTSHVYLLGQDSGGNTVQSGKVGRTCTGPEYAVCSFSAHFPGQLGINWYTAGVEVSGGHQVGSFNMSCHRYDYT